MDETKKFLTLQLQELFESLTAACDDLKARISYPAMKAKIQRVDELKVQYNTLRKEILQYNSRVTSSKEEVSTRSDTFNVMFDAIYSKYFEIQEKKTQPDASQNAVVPINLQPLQLVKFDGSIDRWNQFKTLFDSLVHNNPALPNIQKLHYLKAHLIGEAAALIDNIAIEDTNYQLCYDIIKGRYSSPRRLLNFYLGLILNFAPKDAKDYSKALTTHVSAVQGIKSLKLQDPLDALLTYLCYRNLSSQDKQNFDTAIDPSKVPTTEQLFDFLKRRVQTAELNDDLAPKAIAPYRPPSKRNVSMVASQSQSTQSKIPACGFCNEQHKIYSCAKFLQLDPSDRRKWAIKHRKCLRCLGNHEDISCGSTGTCKECNSEKHHTFLHPTNDAQAPLTALTRAVERKVLLGTIKVRIQDNCGKWVQVRGVLDSASQLNLMTRACARKLHLPITSSAGVMTGVSGKTSQLNGEITCSLEVANGNQLCHFAVLDTICTSQPNFIVNEDLLSRFRHLQLADDTFHENAPIEVLLGADLVASLISTEAPSYIPGEPAALRTYYGYVIFGKVETNHTDEPIALALTNDDLNNELRKFWEAEQIQTLKIESPEDVFCEDLFVKTVSRNAEGRYCVRLPLKPNCPALGDNREKAFDHYKNLERRLLHEPGVKEQYDAFLLNYLDLGYMTETPVRVNYVHTHHAVFKESSSTALRVVFNGSTPDADGRSLNSLLYPGPKLQASLPDILDNFRSHPVVVLADIQKMFNQILVNPEDCKLQHIFWRHPSARLVKEYELKRLSFGHVSSPWLALRVIKQLISDEGHNFPAAASVLSKWTYVDDILAGVDSLDEGKTLMQQLTGLLNKGGFQLKKWISNSKELLSGLADNDLETPRTFKDESPYFKVLGINWLPGEDVFSFYANPFEGAPTKRKIMAYIARLFDPCGWCAPVVLKAKTFIQKTWLLGVDWDDEIPEPLCSQWKNFVSNFHLLSELRIPRNIASIHARYRLLGFSDGSSEAYGCCLYLQEKHSINKKCYLLRAKSKVCPLRTLSIPRIELLAAHSLVKLVQSVMHKHFPVPVDDVFYFTDSEIVLHWIGSSPHTLKTFVANRVSEILELTSPNQWRHVKGEDNPSDPISRGLSPKQLLECTLYWQGPTFLAEPIDRWPPNPALKPDFDVPERKPHLEAVNICENDGFIDNISRYSSLFKLQNVFAYVLRFTVNCRRPNDRQLGPLTSTERRKALEACAYVTQQYYFRDVITRLTKNQPLPPPFKKLTPFVDSNRLLRAGGRLRRSDLPYDAKHPVILPKTCHLATLLCDHYHITLLHAGAHLVQATIQRQWWILSIRSLLRQRIFKCIKCYRLKATPPQPLMADLPESRAKTSRVFAHVGTDFCGPFTIKESKRRKTITYKSYLCVFVCMATKAVHLEVVSDLSTAAFLACFDRFTSRRSLPSCVYSDRGTNYQGAAHHLKEVENWLQEQHNNILSNLSLRSVEWKFSPPNGPNFGGLWESAVKSAKTLLLRTVGAQTLTFEELVTVFTKIEAILNSRPLTPLTSTPDDGTDFLTPGHFLVGGPLISSPEKDDGTDVAPRTRWENVRQITRHFWKRWSHEYLHTLIARKKWTEPTPDLQYGQIVIVKRLNTEPLAWPMGRIVDTHPGKDGIVRVVTVKTAQGTYIRPANTLIPLP